MNCAAVLVAAGAGLRLAADRPKAFVELAGRPLFVHAVQRLVDSAVLDLVVVVVPPGLVESAGERLAPWPQARVVAGGGTRHASVTAGLAALDPQVEGVLVHDAARCLAPPSLIGAVAGALEAGHVAVVPGLALADTVKRVDREGHVLETLDRAALRAVQTPQGFALPVLREAHRRAPDELHTDDAALVEGCGHDVLVIPGDPHALKITTPADLAVAQFLLSILGRAPC